MGRQTLRARSLALIFRFRVNVPGCIRNISAVQYANEVVHELGSADAIVGIYVEEVGVDRMASSSTFSRWGSQGSSGRPTCGRVFAFISHPYSTLGPPPAV
jgi:hypothetical protein